MDPKRLLATAVIPAHSELERLGIKDTPAARRLSLAIALQETRLKNRRQVVAGGAEAGPAVSFWQFERAGGCRGVLTHRSSAAMMKAICEIYNVQAAEAGLWTAMQYQDIVAAAAARLLIYTLPSAMAQTQAEGWEQYIAAWRPGKPHESTWTEHWATAGDAVEVM